MEIPGEPDCRYRLILALPRQRDGRFRTELLRLSDPLHSCKS